MLVAFSVGFLTVELGTAETAASTVVVATVRPWYKVKIAPMLVEVAGVVMTALNAIRDEVAAGVWITQTVVVPVLIGYLRATN